jgi:hypothetical protein
MGSLLEVPGRILLDTCVLNTIQDEGAYIFEGEYTRLVGPT